MSRGWTGVARRVTAAVLAALVVVLAPVSLVAGWAWSQVSDTDRFVATYAPLARSPEVSELVGTAVSEAVLSRLGVAGRLPATRRLVTEATDAVLASDALNTAWTASLRLAHSQAITLLAADPGTVEINDGALQLQLAPFVDAVRQRLVASGVPFANRIPEVDVSVTLAHLDADTVARARLGYRVLGAVAAWLPGLTLLTAVAAAFVWPSRRGGLILAGSAALLGAGILAVALTQAAAVAPTLTPENVRPVTALFVSTALAAFPSPVLALFVAGAAAAGTGALSLRTAD